MNLHLTLNEEQQKRVIDLAVEAMTLEEWFETEDFRQWVESFQPEKEIKNGNK